MSIIRSISLAAAAAFVLLPGTVQAQLGFGFGSSDGQEQKESYFTAAAKSSTDAYKKGEAFYIALQGTVKATWHAYFRNPGTVGMPMEASLQAPAGFKVEGPYWEVPHRAESEIGVAYAYENPVVVWKVTPEADAPANATFTISAMVQVCSDMGCADPEDHTLSVDLAEGEPAAKADWNGLEAKVETLGDTETTVSATSTGTEVVLTFTSATPVEKAYFFSDDNSTSPTAEQKLAKTGDSQYTLTIPRNDNSDCMYPVQDEAMVGKPLASVSGILTFGDKHAKVNVTTGGEAPAPAATAEEPTTTATDEPAKDAEADDEEEEGDEEEEDGDDAEEAGEEPAPAAKETAEDAQPTPAEDCYVSLTPKTSTAAYKKGESFYLAITGDVKATWHAYYRNPATFGEAMSSTLQAPAGFKVEGPYWGIPHREVSEIGVGFIYEHPVVVWKVTPEADAPQQAEFKFVTKAQVCSAVGCMPTETHVDSMVVPEGEPAAKDDWNGLEAKVETLGDTETTVSATSTGTETVLTFTSATPVEKAYFFSDDNSASPTAEQKLAKTGDGQYTLTIPRNDNSDAMQPVADESMVGKPLSHINGLLTFGDKHAKVGIDVTTGETPAATTPAKEPAEPATPAATEPKPAEQKPAEAAPADSQGYEVAKGAHPVWNAWSQATMEKALADGHPVFVDFTAKWCMTCQSNKKLGYNDAVYAEMEKAGVVLMRADKTKPSPEIDKAMRELNRSSVPVNALYRPGKQTAVTKEVFTSDYLLEFLQENLYSETTAAPVEEEEKMGFAALIGSLFLGGLILNLMPCVFPVIGLKVMSFVELGGGSRGKVFAHSMVFALGILFSFWILSLLLIVFSNLDVLASTPWTDWFSVILNDTGSDARNWAAWMQNPWVVYLILLLLLVLGLSMYGVFEIGVGATGVGQGLQQKKGLSGSFFQGFLVTVVATPCSGPFLGAAMPAVMALPGMQMILGLTFMALGLASPYIVLGAFPSLVSALPRPGAWMESLKQGLSFLLFGAAAWMLYTYMAYVPEDQPIETLFLLWCMVGVCCAFWVYGRWCPIYQSKTSRIVGLLVALTLLAVSVFYSNPAHYAPATEEPAPEATEAK